MTGRPNKKDPRAEFVRRAMTGKVSPEDVVEATTVDPELTAAIAKTAPYLPPEQSRGADGRFATKRAGVPNERKAKR